MDIVRESIDGAAGRYAGDRNIIDGYDWRLTENAWRAGPERPRSARSPEATHAPHARPDVLWAGASGGQLPSTMASNSWRTMS
jgi:hypothetical protein